jgi:ATP-dependent DNA helicase PIF1
MFWLPQHDEIVQSLGLDEVEAKSIRENRQTDFPRIVHNKNAKLPIMSGTKWPWAKVMVAIKALQDSRNLSEYAAELKREPKEVAKILATLGLVSPAEQKSYLETGKLKVDQRSLKERIALLVEAAELATDSSDKVGEIRRGAPKKTDVVITDEFERGFKMLERPGAAVFVTGVGGTGKSVFIREVLKRFKNVAIAAPTGNAALNVGGMTTNSMFALPPEAEIDRLEPLSAKRTKLLQAIELLIIEEISMVNAIQMMCIDHRLRQAKGVDKPFGGVTLLKVGDLLQLSPVVTEDQRARICRYGTPYFFSAPVFKELDMQVLELTRVFRTSDEEFASVLCNLRTGRNLTDAVRFLNRKCFLEKQDQAKVMDGVALVPTRNLAASINEKALAALPGKATRFTATYSGTLKAGTDKVNALEHLDLKVGLRVVLCKNNPEEGYVNGSLGRVKKIDGERVVVTLDSGKNVDVEKQKWEDVQLVVGTNKSIQSEVVGTCWQMPILPATAMTIHRAQGMSLPKVHVHLHPYNKERGAHYNASLYQDGQVYVAASRAMSVGGLSLEYPLAVSSVRVNPHALAFCEQHGIKGIARPLVDKAELAPPSNESAPVDERIHAPAP